MKNQFGKVDSSGIRSLGVDRGHDMKPSGLTRELTLRRKIFKGTEH